MNTITKSIGAWPYVAAAFLAASGVAVSRAEASVTQTKSTLVDHVAGKPLEVRNESGDLEIEKTTSERVRVKAEIKAEDKDRAAQTQISAERDSNGTLVVKIKWPGGERKAMESASIKVEIPDVSSIDAQTENGEIELEGLSGKAELRTTNGGVDVEGHKGSLKFETSNGKSEVSGVTGKVEAKGINGGMSFEKIGGPVNIETTNGSLSIRLTPENAGPIKAKTVNGEVKVKVGKAFAGSVKAEAMNGDVSVELPGMIKSMKQERNSQSVELNTSGETSELSATNGDVTVQLAE